jgi:hypothetical protein
MLWVIVLVILALILGGVGLFAKALWWLLIIGGILLLVSIVLGLVQRRR